MSCALSENEGISILVAMYNGSRFIVEQLESILAQIAPEDELLVLDDQSTDDSYAIAKAMEARHPGLKVIRSEQNGGVVKTFEALISLATKDIIFLCDQDDIWIAGRKGQMLAAMRDDLAVAVLANSSIYVDGERVREFFPTGYRPNTSSISKNFFKNNFIGCCMAFRREILTLALPFPDRISMHDWWLATCAMSMGKVTYSEQPSLLYRRHSANLSPSTRRKLKAILKDRIGNLLAITVLFRRAARLKIQGKI